MIAVAVIGQRRILGECSERDPVTPASAACSGGALALSPTEVLSVLAKIPATAIGTGRIRL